MTEERKHEPIHESVESPCKGYCILDEYGYCGVCRRTMAEILAWPDMSNEQKRRVLDEIARRNPKASSLAPPKG